MASDRSAYVTGTEIVVDGGLTNGGVSTARLHLLGRSADGSTANGSTGDAGG